MAYLKETYIAEWVLAYEQVLAQSMKSLSEGKNTPVEELFRLIEATSADTSIIERLSLKKDVYMQLITSLTASSQATASHLTDKKFLFDKELEVADLQTEKFALEKEKAASEKLLVEEQVRNLKLKNGWDGTVYDNKLSDAYQQIKVRRAQVALTKRQTEAFNDNKDKEILKLATDGHTMLFETLQDSSVAIPNWYTSSGSIEVGDSISVVKDGEASTESATCHVPGLNELMTNAMGGSKDTNLTFLADPEATT